MVCPVVGVTSVLAVVGNAVICGASLGTWSCLSSHDPRELGLLISKIGLHAAGVVSEAGS